MNEKKYLKIIDNFGKEVSYEILCAFWLEKTEKNYVVYTDETTDDDGNLNVFASIYYPQDNSKLESIKTEEEWLEIEKRLKDIQQQYANEEVF